MSAVASNQKFAIALRVCPLNGTVPRILSKADSRSVVMIVRTPSLT